MLYWSQETAFWSTCSYSHLCEDWEEGSVYSILCNLLVLKAYQWGTRLTVPHANFHLSNLVLWETCYSRCKYVQKVLQLEYDETARQHVDVVWISSKCDKLFDILIHKIHQCVDQPTNSATSCHSHSDSTMVVHHPSYLNCILKFYHNADTIKC